MKLAATGHRPDKLGGYGLDVLTSAYRLALSHLQETRPATVISGLALGWDTAIALAAIKLGIPLTAVVPFNGQDSRWPEESRERYRKILDRAAEVVVVSPGGYAPHKMQVRNEWMVDRGDSITALWDGSPGGTANCVGYAEKVGKPIVNLWPRWTA
jgi:uncharacterized phage-like protein YoqJ